MCCGDFASLSLVQPSHYGGEHFFASRTPSLPYTHPDLILGYFIPLIFGAFWFMTAAGFNLN